MKYKLQITTLILVLLCLPTLLSAQVESIFNGIAFENSLQTVQKKLNTISESTRLISIDNPSFPLAKFQEDHLICSNVNTKNGIVKTVVFTFADDKLCYIEATGNVVNVFALDTLNETYLHYKANFAERIISDPKKDKVWLLTEASAHPNLFTWENPYTHTDDYKSVKYNSSGKIPEFITMGASLEVIEPLFKAKSDFISTMELDGSDPFAQLQIDCFGIEYAGFPRKFEARFGGNKLNVLWILTGKGEEDRIRQELIKHYGKPIFINDDWEIFNDWQIGLRKDKPEVLVMTKEIGMFYKKDYFKQ